MDKVVVDTLIVAIQRVYSAEDELKSARKALRQEERDRVQGSQREFPGAK